MDGEHELVPRRHLGERPLVVPAAKRKVEALLFILSGYY
jgi:hypothetical protein